MYNVCGRKQWAACTCDTGQHILGKLQVLGLEERVETWLQVDEGRSCGVWRVATEMRGTKNAKFEFEFEMAFSNMHVITRDERRTFSLSQTQTHPFLLPLCAQDHDRFEHLVCVRFGVHMLRPQSDCVYLDVFGAFCFCRADDDDDTALYRVAELERPFTGLSEDCQPREIRKHSVEAGSG